MQNPQDVQLAVAALQGRLPASFLNPLNPPLGLVLGTGLGGVADAIATTGDRIPFSLIDAFPQSSVPSHEGAFAFGVLAGLPVLAQLGRCHLYEGRTPAEVCMGVRVMAGLGLTRLIITNAAGALNPLFEAGSLMCMSDMINHTGVSPLTGPNCDSWGERFPDMCHVFDPELSDLAMQSALAEGIRLERGVYIGVHGPEMETPAETRMYRQWGADAVGMSTVLEILAARHMGMRVLGISCLTNKNLPDRMEPAPFEAIARAAAKVGETLGVLLTAICRQLSGRTCEKANF